MNKPIKVTIKPRTSIITERFSLNSLVMCFFLNITSQIRFSRVLNSFWEVQHNIFLNSIPFKINNERNMFYRVYPI